MQVLLVGLGGFCGAVARYGIGRLMTSGTFPYATLTVNVVGSLFIGLLATAFATRSLETEPFRLFLIVGFLGAFTTFSAFSLETLQLLNSGAWTRAALNILGNLALCLIAVFVGHIVARQLLVQ